MITSEEEQDIIDRSNLIVGEIGPHLMQEKPQVIAIVLGELIARFIAGHDPIMRARAMISMLDLVDRLMPNLLKAMTDQLRGGRTLQ
jgi:hypothetical protein